MPHMCGEVTASTALLATAASAAVPPARSMATPAPAASESMAQTIPLAARCRATGSHGSAAQVTPPG